MSEGLNINDLLTSKPIFYNQEFKDNQGVGMTSQRTRNRLVKELIELGITDYSILSIIKTTPRHLFLDEAMASRSYENTALPIGFAQTISHPLAVARMSAWLFQNGSLCKVLEVGTGSGYQTAILAQLSKHVYSVERIEALLLKANRVFKKLNLKNIQTSLSDGHMGWKKHAKYDGIISAASPTKVPEELLEQLTTGGRLVTPIGDDKQLLYGFIKTETGYTKECLGEVLFVPMKTGLVNTH